MMGGMRDGIEGVRKGKRKRAGEWGQWTITGVDG